MFAKLIETLKANPRTLVFTEGHDARILEATARLKKDGFLTPILVGAEDEVKAAAQKGGFDIEGVLPLLKTPNDERRAHAQLSGISNGISSSMQTSSEPRFS